MCHPPCLPDGKRYHVFISYATEEGDKQIADQLYSQLSALNYRCCIHEIEFKAGRLIQENIEKSLKKSLKTVIILSENFNKSFWCHVEMTEIVQLHMDNKGFPPIILKLDSCEVPKALRPYTYLALQAGLGNEMSNIIEAINNLDQKGMYREVYSCFFSVAVLDLESLCCWKIWVIISKFYNFLDLTDYFYKFLDSSLFLFRFKT